VAGASCSSNLPEQDAPATSTAKTAIQKYKNGFPPTDCGNDKIFLASQMPSEA
jgi:hypothetical protein